MRLLNHQIMTSLSIAAANQTSSAVDGSYVFGASVQAVVAGGTSPTGTFKLQASNDPPNATPTNWSDIPSASVAITDNGTYLIPYQSISYQWLRLVYTRTSGSGTITSATMKTIGA